MRSSSPRAGRGNPPMARGTAGPYRRDMTQSVLIAGGGIAALELVLALREHAPQIPVTVVAPNAEFVARPLLVTNPLHATPAPRRPLARIAAELGFRLVTGAVAAVEPGRVVLRGGGTLPYETLVLAPGATLLPAFDDAIHIGDPDSAGQLARLGADARAGDVGRIAFVAPTLTGWLLPLYEAALLTAGLGARHVSLVTAEQAPLEMFGAAASATVAATLRAAGIEFVGDHHGPVEADQIVSLPLVRGPRLPGVPADDFGLIPIDGYGRVTGLAHVYAIGDATDYPIKQGGIACQQADTVAAHIAGRAERFEPRLGAILLTPDGELALGDAPPAKLPGRHLGPYLAAA